MQCIGTEMRKFTHKQTKKHAKANESEQKRTKWMQKQVVDFSKNNKK